MVFSERPTSQQGALLLEGKPDRQGRQDRGKCNGGFLQGLPLTTNHSAALEQRTVRLPEDASSLACLTLLVASFFQSCVDRDEQGL